MDLEMYGVQQKLVHFLRSSPSSITTPLWSFEVNPERCLLDDVPLDEGDGGRPVMTYGAHAFDQTLLRGKAGEVLPALVARVRALRDTGRE